MSTAGGRQTDIFASERQSVKRRIWSLEFLEWFKEYYKALVYSLLMTEASFVVGKFVLASKRSSH